MSKELTPDNFGYFTNDLCEFVPTEYCHHMNCGVCPFRNTPGVAIVMLYRTENKEDENK